MSAPSPSPAISSSEGYRPLSLLAIFAFGLGILSFLTWVELPSIPALLFALPAFILSLYARLRIRNSEGTLAGAWLATAGLALSVINGLAWITANQTTQWLLLGESRKFADSWLEKLKEGKAGEAYLDTRPPLGRRVPFHPEDHDKLRGNFTSARGSRSDFDDFLRVDMIQILLRQGSSASWEYRGVHNLAWLQDVVGGYYLIEHRYYFKSPEIEGELIVPVRSDKERDQTTSWREWQVVLQGVVWAGADKVKRNPVFDEVGRKSAEAIVQFTKQLHETSTEQGLLESLGSSLNAQDVAQVKILYNLMRPSGQLAARFTRAPQPLLHRYAQKGNTWEMHFSDEFAADNTFISYLATVEVTIDPQGKVQSGRITSVKFEGYRTPQ